MNLRDLEYLVAVDELRHFRKAAEKCFVSQPTLSGQIKKLESYLDVQLVERGKGKVLMTPVGKQIVAHARTLLHESRSIEELAKSGGNLFYGKLHMGLIPTLAPYLLPVFMDRVKDTWPDLELLLTEGQTSVLLEKLETGDLDVLILAFPVDNDTFTEIPIFEEPFYLAVSECHPFADHISISAEALAGEELMLLEEGHCLRGQALDVCVTAGAKEMERFRATSMETLRHMVAAGTGITLIPKLAAIGHNSGRWRQIRYIPFSQPVPSRTVGMLVRKSSGNPDDYQQLARVIGAAAREALDMTPEVIP